MDDESQIPKRSYLRRLWQPHEGSADLFSTAASFSFPIGAHIASGSVRGYHIDFSIKPESPHWPPRVMPPRDQLLFVALSQWGLGCYERYLSGEGEEWLAGAIAAADHLIATQESEGRLIGGWLHRFPFQHTYELKPPWLSGMAQGEGASLLVRIALETEEDRYSDAARLALRSMRVPSSEGGALARLDGGFFPEEYPTIPPSFVLNGGIFALWGCYDLGIGLGDADALEMFEEGLETLSRNIERYDLGYWSRYDLFPHPVLSIASSGYHHLHINQLRAMSRISVRPEIVEIADRFESYLDSRLNFAHAFGRKVLFRLVVPRNRLLAHRLPWSHRQPV